MYLRKHGGIVNVQEDSDRATFTQKNGIPESAASCHTAEVDGYLIEGHVPVEAIHRLLADRPKAVGLSVPEMPADSPGMGGDAQSWAQQRVLLIGTNGSTTAWSY